MPFRSTWRYVAICIPPLAEERENEVIRLLRVPWRFNEICPSRKGPSQPTICPQIEFGDARPLLHSPFCFCSRFRVLPDEVAVHASARKGHRGRLFLDADRTIWHSENSHGGRSRTHYGVPDNFYQNRLGQARRLDLARHARQVTATVILMAAMLPSWVDEGIDSDLAEAKLATRGEGGTVVTMSAVACGGVNCG